MQWFMGGQCGRVKTVHGNSRTAKHNIEVEDMVTAKGLLAFCTSIFWPIWIFHIKENERGIVTQLPSYR